MSHHKKGDLIVNIYTSRYANPELKSGDYITVSISTGFPKFRTGYTINLQIKEITPYGVFGVYKEYEDYKREYFKRLDSFGVPAIQRHFDIMQRCYEQDIVLLCFEDIRKGGDNWCHRTMFAEWWLSKTGQVIEELSDPTPYKTDKPKHKIIHDLTDNSEQFKFQF